MICNYKYVKNSDLARKEIEQKLIENNKILADASCKIYGFSNIKRLRDEYKSGLVKLKHEKYFRARVAINWMIKNEEKIILSFVPIVQKICNSFSRSDCIRSNTEEDLMQIGMMSIYDYIYEYNGKSKLISYLTLVVKCRLIDTQRSDKKISGYSGSVYELQKMVNDTMSLRQCSLNMAISYLQKENVNITKEEWSRVYDIMSYDDNYNDIIDKVPESKSLNLNSQYLEIIECASLNNVEKGLIYAHIQGDKSYRNNLIKKINPKTGNCWTKQRLSQIFQEACKKLKSQMRKSREAAAA